MLLSEPFSCLKAPPLENDYLSQNLPMKKKDSRRVKVLFVCIGNACRSPMAEAIARLDAADTIEAFSAGLAPIGFVAGMTKQTLTENGYWVEGLESKSISPKVWDEADIVINMSGRVREAAFSECSKVQDWEIDDPFGDDPDSYQRVFEKIHQHVTQLAQECLEVLSSPQPGITIHGSSADGEVSEPREEGAVSSPEAVPAFPGADGYSTFPTNYARIRNRLGKKPFQIGGRLARNQRNPGGSRLRWGMLATLGVLIGLISLNLGWMEAQHDARSEMTSTVTRKTEISTETVQAATSHPPGWTPSIPSPNAERIGARGQNAEAPLVEKHAQGTGDNSPRNPQRQGGSVKRPSASATLVTLSRGGANEPSQGKPTKEPPPAEPIPLSLSVQKVEPRPIKTLSAPPPQLEAKVTEPPNLAPPSSNDIRPPEPKAKESFTLSAKQPANPPDIKETVAIQADPYPSLRIANGSSSKKQRQGTSLLLGHLLSRVEPAYPAEAKQQGIQGTVKLHAIIGRNGSVKNLESVDGSPILVAAAMNAVRQWRYTETLLAGQSVETEEDIAIIFRLSNPSANKQ
jgi:TonB family protein